MPTVSLKAHYDGERIQLDEPFDLPPDVPLLVTVLVVEADNDREACSVSIDPLASTAVFEQNVEYPGGLRKRRHVCFSLGGVEAEPNPPLQPAGCDGG